MGEALVSLKHQDGVAQVTICNPPVNALSRAVRSELWELVQKLDADPAVIAVVLAGSSKVFIGGADINEFDRALEAPFLSDLIDRIETAAKPWIGAVNGLALGGGTEIVLGCRARVASPAAVFGLPEVSLGIIPGAGGTQRLPRLIGVHDAFEVIAEGRQLDAQSALSLGLVDAIFDNDLLQQATEFALKTARIQKPTSARAVQDPGEAFWDESHARIAKAAKGNPAPLKALGALRYGLDHGFAAGMANERQTFLSLRSTEAAAALRYLFFAERAAGKPRSLRDAQARPLTTIGVVGGGTMGTGIAAALGNAGYTVLLSEQTEESLARSLEKLDGIFAAQAKRRGKDTKASHLKDGIVTGIVGLDGIAACDLVIEAVFEDITVKRELFARLGQICRPDAILATNTSYLDPEQIAADLAHPERFLALHFFSPAHVMKLLEIVPTAATAPDTLATGFALARRLGKIPVRAGNCSGFIGNRILKRYRAEAEAMMREGIAIPAIDATLRGFGFPMGPFEAQDLAGLDIAFKVREAERANGVDVLETMGDRLVRAGRFGQKSGGGWYDYQPGDRTPRPSSSVETLLADHRGEPLSVAPHVITERALAAMTEEARAILDEGYADTPQAIDLVLVHGYGFPRWKGGPMFMTRQSQA